MAPTCPSTPRFSGTGGRMTRRRAALPVSRARPGTSDAPRGVSCSPRGSAGSRTSIPTPNPNPNWRQCWLKDVDDHSPHPGLPVYTKKAGVVSSTVRGTTLTEDATPSITRPQPAVAAGPLPTLVVPPAPPVVQEPPDGTSPQERQQRVLGAMRHAWGGYRAKAWGADEYRPKSGSRVDGR